MALRHALLALSLSACGLFSGGEPSRSPLEPVSHHGLATSLEHDKLLARKTQHESTPSATLSAHFDEATVRALAETRSYRSGMPQQAVVTPNGQAVIFLRSEARKPAQSVFKLDVATGHVLRLCSPEEVFKNPDALSPAERERRERLRQTATGFTSFELTPDGLSIVLPLAGHLFVFDRMTGNVRELPVDGAFDPHLSPDGKRVAYVRDNDVRILDLDGRSPEVTITRGGTDKVPHGMAEFIAQEELDRERGFWFSPDGKRIAFEEADQSGVDVLHIPDPSHPEREPQKAYYPRAGKPNAVVRFGLISSNGGPATWIDWDYKKFPYVAQVRWDDGAPLTMYVLDRTQKNGELLAVDDKSGKTHALLTEHDDAWLNVDASVPRWMPDGKSFVWSTERNGSWELELREIEGAVTRAHTILAPGQGYRRVVDLDPDQKRVVVEESAEPTESAVWSVPLGGGTPLRLSLRQGGIAEASGSPHQHGLYPMYLAASHEYPRSVIVDANGKEVATLPSVGELPAWKPELEIRNVGAEGYRVAIIRPHGFIPKRKYPVIDSAYGGPGYVTVTADAFKFIRAQIVADATSSIVVSIDARGTPYRDRAWERAIAGKFGSVPVEGHIDALRALAAEMPEVDLARVGVYGWSFGGYFAVDAILTHPEIYAVGVAGAPPADWHDYDTAYTERYLGVPHDAKTEAVYAASSLLEMARMRTAPRPLLLMHGTADDNVYFSNSLLLAETLARTNRPFNFIPLLGQTHLVADPQRQLLEWRQTVEFLRDKLWGAGGPDSPHYLQ
ncbi:MAG TPA: DPP IV N-terminal domain-containing protein [Polyangiaceae bacterium]